MKYQKFSALFFFSLLLLAPRAGDAQSVVYQVNGASAGEFIGDSLVCRSSGVHVGVTSQNVSSFLDAGQVRVYDNTQAPIYNVNHPVPSASNDRFGYAMIPFPDTNANGVDEVVISAPGDPVSTTASRLFLFDEGLSFSVSPIRSITGGSGDNLGTSLAALDIPTLDGIPEIVAGAPRGFSALGGTGSVEIYNAQSGVRVSRILSQTNVQAFGWSLARLQDLDGNGSDDLAVGAPDSFASRGAVLVYTFDSGGNASLLREIRGINIGDAIGFALSGVGDINGDGVEDLVATSDQGFNERGFFRLFSGSDIVSGAATITPLCEVIGITPGDNLGAGVARLGDADKNQLAEFAIGAPGAAAGFGEIKIYEYVNNQCQAVRTITGVNADDALGRRMGSANCPGITAQADALWASALTDQNGMDSGSVSIYNPPPTATPTPTPMPTCIRP